MESTRDIFGWLEDGPTSWIRDADGNAFDSVWNAARVEVPETLFADLTTDVVLEKKDACEDIYNKAPSDFLSVVC